MKSIRILALGAVIALAMTATAFADNHMMPGKGTTVKPARATWNTGYFQEALVSEGLTQLGYEVESPKELQNPLFYQALVLGDLDYWTNGWFPLHWDQTPNNFDEKASVVGYVIKAGGLQGYLVSKEHAEKFNIKSLDDFKRPEVKKAFDKNGDGKADLVACPPGWGCEKVITHHFDAYNLDPHVNAIKASYSASIGEALAQYKNGEPVFFYTWAPNWTIFKFKPGEDVVWINVPELKPSPAQAPNKDKMTVSGITGAVTDPAQLGFVVNDIRAVANNKFLAENPAAAKFLEVFTLDLIDVNKQNTLMQEGEDSASDIKKHVADWIKNNQEKWNGWLDESRKAAKAAM